jgi:hypothetical protein
MDVLRAWQVEKDQFIPHRMQVRYGFASLVDGFVIILSGGRLDPAFACRVALKNLQHGIAKQKEEG